MSKLMEYKEALDKCLRDKSKPWTQYLELAEAKTGVDRLYVFAGVAGFLALYLVFGFGAQLLCNTIGFAYPAYVSMKAIESPKKDDDTKWLTYWVVYAVFSIVEYFADLLVSWFPLYWLVKCLFQIWCFAPTDYNGSLVIYHRVIRPYFLKYENQVDNLANSASKLVQDTFKKTS